MTRLTRLAFAVLFALPLIAQAQNATGYTFKPNTPVKYLLERKEDMIQDMGGQSMSASTEITLGTALTLKEAKPDGTMRLDCLIDNAIMIVESDQGMKTFGSSLAGKTFWVDLKPNGEALDADTTLREFAKDGAEMLQKFVEALPYIDGSGLKKGGSWNYVKSDTTSGEDTEIIMTEKTEYNVTGVKELKGRSCLEVAYETARTIKGNGEQGGQSFNITGEAKSTGTFLFDAAAGVLVELSSKSSGDQNIAVAGNQSMKIIITTNATGKIEMVD